MHPDFKMARSAGFSNFSFSTRTVILDVESVLLKQIWINSEMEMNLAKSIQNQLVLVKKKGTAQSKC